MNAPPDAPRAFYTERVPAQFNRTLAAQEKSAAAGDEASERLLAGMRTVNATIGVVVQGEREFRHYLNIEDGRMTPGDEALKSPFMTLVHDLHSLATFERASGDSVLGFLGAIAGMPGDMLLTSQRIQNLHGLDGALCFELTGEEGFRITAHFGRDLDRDFDPSSREPGCSISLDAATYDELCGGTLTPQDAFMSGRVRAEGDMQTVMKIALALLSPE